MSSFIDRIPNELLAHTFSLALNDPDENPTFAVTLSHVCPRWRELALTSGDLWARINIIFPLSERQLLHSETFLQRSMQYPLDILIDVRDPEWDWNEETHRVTWKNTVPIIRLLILHVDRWRRFEMLSDNWVPIFTFLYYTKTRLVAPKLETLSLSRCNAYLAASGQTFQPEALRDHLSLLGGMSSALGSLTEVSLVGVHAEWSDNVLRNLTKLEFKFQSADVMPTADQFATILAANPQLLELTILGWGPILEETIPSSKFCIPSLKKFIFGFLDASYAIRLLSFFRVPNIDSLSLEDVNQVVSPINLQLSSVLLDWIASHCSPDSSSSPFPLHSLRFLDIHGMNAEMTSYCRLFTTSTSLELLGLSSINDGGLLALGVIHPNNSGLRCPRLRQLRLQDANPDTLLQVIEARSRNPFISRLHKISLAFTTVNKSIASTPIFARLESAGVDVSISDPEWLASSDDRD